jgi:hypothetical protein
VDHLQIWACHPSRIAGGRGYAGAEMAEDRDERIWRARLRWRLRGAWTGPAFAGLTLAEAVLLHRLPISGDRGPDVIGALLLCGFFNLALVGLVAPLAARVWRRRRGGALPLEVAQDRVATGAMLVLAAALVGVGVVHHAAVRDAERSMQANLTAVRAYVLHQAPHEYLAGLGAESVWKQKDDFYRTCVPGPDPRRNLCLYVDTSGVPTVTRDPDQQSNARIAGTENPGRRGG